MEGGENGHENNVGGYNGKKRGMERAGKQGHIEEKTRGWSNANRERRDKNGYGMQLTKRKRTEGTGQKGEMERARREGHIKRKKREQGIMPTRNGGKQKWTWREMNKEEKNRRRTEKRNGVSEERREEEHVIIEEETWE